jgi:sigma-B regulation protein RsbU (phosphoserine phosphatase)
MANRLLIINPAGERTEQALNSDRLSLGRAGDNNLSYPEDSGLSRHHVAFERLDGAWTVRDLGSKNGTLVNDERISDRVHLNTGDRIRVSRLTLVFDVDPEDKLRATVVFDTARFQTDRPPTHTVTLGELVGEERPEGSGEAPGKQWADPVTALLRAGRELVASKPVEELFEDILDLSLESVGANRGLLMTMEGRELSVRASRGDQFHISTAVRDRVINERTSLLVGDVMSDDILRDRRSIVMQQVHSLMAVPLQTDRSVLGLIYVDSPHAWHQFTPSDLNLLTVMANVAAIRIERERLAESERAREFMEREFEQAAEIQRQFLPSAPPAVRGLDLAGYNRPCHSVGGDYYSFVVLPDGKLILALGDVAGKGMSAALLMVNLQARVQLLAEQPGSPAEMVTSLNRALNVVCPSNRFVTFFLCEIDPRTGETSFSNAGHNPPYLVRADGAVETLAAGGPVLGILPGLTFQPQATLLGPGDTLVVYSDGVTEATNADGDEFGEVRLEEILVRNRTMTAAELVDEVNAELESFVGGAPPNDDITFAVARRTAY